MVDLCFPILSLVVVVSCIVAPGNDFGLAVMARLITPLQKTQAQKYRTQTIARVHLHDCEQEPNSQYSKRIPKTTVKLPKFHNIPNTQWYSTNGIFQRIKMASKSSSSATSSSTTATNQQPRLLLIPPLEWSFEGLDLIRHRTGGPESLNEVHISVVHLGKAAEMH